MGQVVEMRAAQGTRPTPNLPIPTVSLTLGGELLGLPIVELQEAMRNPDNRQAVQDARLAVCKLLEPARPPQIAGHMARLANHYHATPRGEAAAECYAEDWLEDLAHLPDDIIEAACVHWRRGANKFMCSPGELLAHANEILKWRKFYADRAESVLRGQGDD